MRGQFLLCWTGRVFTAGLHTVAADPYADIAALRARLEALTLPHVRCALAKPDLPVALDLTRRTPPPACPSGVPYGFAKQSGD